MGDVAPAEFARWYVSKAPVKAAAYAARYAEAGDDFMRGRAAAIRQALPEAQRCSDCGRELKDPDSIARGVGPDCWEARNAG